MYINIYVYIYCLVSYIYKYNIMFAVWEIQEWTYNLGMVWLPAKNMGDFGDGLWNWVSQIDLSGMIRNDIDTVWSSHPSWYESVKY